MRLSWFLQACTAGSMSLIIHCPCEVVSCWCDQFLLCLATQCRHVLNIKHSVWHTCFAMQTKPECFNYWITYKVKTYQITMLLNT